jgi:hypothetical protein
MSMRAREWLCCCIIEQVYLNSDRNNRMIQLHCVQRERGKGVVMRATRRIKLSNI